MPEIARQQAIKLGLGEASCLEYFTECIHYDIGTREREAMQLFQQMLARKD
jgi:predicted solute-binding protein